MKILGLAGSPRRNGNTDLLLAEFLRGAAAKGAEVKTIYLNNLKIAGCQHCDDCFKEGKCKIQDNMQQIYTELEDADVIVLTEVARTRRNAYDIYGRWAMGLKILEIDPKELSLVSEIFLDATN